MRYLSVCSGIEAASVAWEPLGWEPAGFAEVAPFPAAVLAHHWPHVRNFGDFTTIQPDDTGPIDLLVGGTPCQSFSVAGLRGGLADERGNLALEYLALAGRLRPRWLVWENVPGVLSSSGGRDFGAFLGGLVELGYGFAYRVLDAQFFGVAQRRRRVFVVGHAGDWRRAAAVLFERASLRGDPAPSRQAGKGVANSLVERPDRGGGNSEGQRLIAHTLRARANSPHREGSDNFVASTPRQHTRPGSNDVGSVVAHTLRGNGFDASEDGTGRGTPLVAASLCADSGRLQNAHAGRSDAESETLLPVHSVCMSSDPIWAKDLAMPQTGRHGDPGVVAIAPSLTATNDPSRSPQSSEVTQQVAAVHQPSSAVRRLTPVECERLQGFPDGHTAVPYRGKPAADGPRYKAIGNSMAVPVMRWIGERIGQVEPIPPAP